MPRVVKNDPLKPTLALLVKLGSIAIHAEEMLLPSGHAFDRQAMLSLLVDPEVSLWLKAMDELQYLPKKR